MPTGGRSAAERVVVIGAGPAGLTAARELLRLGARPSVLEATGEIGGISQTVDHRGYRFDIGGHRFYTKVEAVQRIWEELLKEELLLRPRLSRIYYGGKFFTYPLDVWNVLSGLGPLEAARAGLSYLAARLRPAPGPERTFEDWVTRRFGRRLFEIFFETYTEKVWGIPCSEIDAAWASQRLRNLDFATLLKSMLFRSAGRRGHAVASLVHEFHYPRYGPGQMWERCAGRLIAQGVDLRMNERVERVLHDGRRIHAVATRDAAGAETEHPGDAFVSSMPLRELVRAFDPVLPAEVISAANALRYRDFLTVGLILDRERVFPDNWLYIHSDEVRVGRIQNFKNWSIDMVPDPSTTSLGLEYFVQEGDELWSAPDADLVELASHECEVLGLIDAGDVIDGTVIRMPRAYPVYDASYREAVAVIRDALAGFENLEAVGRNGQHRYNNQDHSMLTGILAAENLVAGAAHDVWSVNTDPDHLEEAGPTAGDPLVPREATPESLDELIRAGFARYDPVALGGALGIVAGAGLFLATLVLLLPGGDEARPMLSLLGNYLSSYEVSWAGAWLGLVEAGALGFALGWGLARLLNAVIAREQRRLEERIERVAAMALIDGTA